MYVADKNRALEGRDSFGRIGMNLLWAFPIDGLLGRPAPLRSLRGLSAPEVSIFEQEQPRSWASYTQLPERFAKSGKDSTGLT